MTKNNLQKGRGKGSGQTSENSAATAEKPPEKRIKTARNRKKSRPPVVIAVFGRPHSGKTWNIERRLAKSYKGTVIVYNYGRDEDWSGYIRLEIVDNPKTKTSDGKACLIQTEDGKIYNFADIHKLYPKGSRIKIGMADDSKEQDKFFKAVVKAKDMMLIVDDSTAVLGTTLTNGLKRLIARAKHNRVDVVLIAHAIDVFPVRAYSFVTNIRLFVTDVAPSKSKLLLLPFREEIIAAFHELKTLPKYSYIDFYLQEARTITHIPPKK